MWISALLPGLDRVEDCREPAWQGLAGARASRAVGNKYCRARTPLALGRSTAGLPPEAQRFLAFRPCQGTMSWKGRGSVDQQKTGAFICGMRKERASPQRELAEQLNVTDKAVPNGSRGLSYPDITILSDLARALGVTERELLTGARESAAGAECPAPERWCRTPWNMHRRRRSSGASGPPPW